MLSGLVLDPGIYWRQILCLQRISEYQPHINYVSSKPWSNVNVNIATLKLLLLSICTLLILYVVFTILNPTAVIIISYGSEVKERVRSEVGVVNDVMVITCGDERAKIK